MKTWRGKNKFWLILVLSLGMGLLEQNRCFAKGQAEPSKKPPGTKQPPPADQQKLRERYEQFKKLPPEEQQKLRQRQKEFEQLSPEQKQELKRRHEFFQQLTPEQREQARRFVRRWQAMPPERRAMLSRRFNHLRTLPPKRQAKAFANWPFWQQLSPGERQTFVQFFDKVPQEPSVQPKQQQ